ASNASVVLVVVKSIAGALDARRVFLQARHARAVRFELDAQLRVGAAEPGVGLVIGQGVGLARAGQPAVGAAQAAGLAEDPQRVGHAGLGADVAGALRGEPLPISWTRLRAQFTPPCAASRRGDPGAPAPR